jgi:LysM repeat protein
MQCYSRAARRALLAVAALGGLVFSFLSVGEAQSAGLDSRLAAGSDAYELIDAVNALRIANGLPPYNVHSILMGTAQAQADYMAAARTVTHYGPDGSRPYQRALAAGYPLAGDLSQGGFMSENIIAGTNLSAQEAVSAWQGDAPHLHTMLSTYAQDIGAGVATVGDYVYYVIDVALATGSVPRYTPGPDGTFPTAVYYAPLVSTIYPSTPAADGVVRHKVESGETLWLIAITYGTKIDAIRALNNLAPDAPLHPGLDLLIFPAGTVTPGPPNRAGPTMLSKLATATAQVTRPTPENPPPVVGAFPAAVPDATPRPSAQNEGKGRLGAASAMSRSSGVGLVVLIIGGSLLVAALFAFRGRDSD